MIPNILSIKITPNIGIGLNSKSMIMAIIMDKLWVTGTVGVIRAIKETRVIRGTLKETTKETRETIKEKININNITMQK
jgi:hypothetical protein